MNKALEYISEKEIELTNQVQTGNFPPFQEFLNKKMTDIFNDLQTSDMIALNILNSDSNYVHRAI